MCFFYLVYGTRTLQNCAITLIEEEEHQHKNYI